MVAVMRQGPSMTISSPSDEPLIADWMVAASLLALVQLAFTREACAAVGAEFSVITVIESASSPAELAM